MGEGRKCQVVDDMDLLDDDNLDKKYYVEKAMTKIMEIVGEHKTISLPKKVLQNIAPHFDYWFLQYTKGNKKS